MKRILSLLFALILCVQALVPCTAKAAHQDGTYYTYDSHGYPVSMTEYEYGAVQCQIYYDNTYDSQGRITKIVQKNKVGCPFYTQAITYHHDGSYTIHSVERRGVRIREWEFSPEQYSNPFDAFSDNPFVYAQYRICYNADGTVRYWVGGDGMDEIPFDVAAGVDHTVILYADHVEAVGSNYYGQCNVDTWKNIVQVSTLRYHTVGLTADGTVVATGPSADGQCDVADWRNIVAVAAGEHHTVGLRADGTVVATGLNRGGECDVDNWKDIVAITASYGNTLGLRSDGTVVTCGYAPQSGFDRWSDIVAIDASDSHYVGLTSGGRVFATGSNNFGQCNVSNWTDVVQVVAGCGYTVGLRSDGTVLFTGINDVYQRAAIYWKDVAVITSGLEHVVGIHYDGTLVAAGANDNLQCYLPK